MLIFGTTAKNKWKYERIKSNVCSDLTVLNNGIIRMLNLRCIFQIRCVNLSGFPFLSFYFLMYGVYMRLTFEFMKLSINFPIKTNSMHILFRLFPEITTMSSNMSIIQLSKLPKLAIVLSQIKNQGLI